MCFSTTEKGKKKKGVKKLISLSLSLSVSLPLSLSLSLFPRLISSLLLLVRGGGEPPRAGEVPQRQAPPHAQPRHGELGLLRGHLFHDGERVVGGEVGGECLEVGRGGLAVVFWGWLGCLKG